MKKYLSIAIVTMAIWSCQEAEPTNTISLQTIYTNGDILTMRGSSPEYVEALVEENGRIVFVGTRGDAEAQFAKATVVDLEGKTLLPGFLDGHGHLYNTGLLSMVTNLLPPPDGPGADFDAIVKAMKAWRVSEDGQFISGKMGWIIGNGYDDSQLKEKNHPTKEVLDRISTDVPIVIIHQSGHLACVNSKALEIIGYSKDSHEIEGGVIRRDVEGNPNGVLEEAAFFNSIMPILAKGTDEELSVLCVEKGQDQYAMNGYLTAQDGRTTPDQSAALALAAKNGKCYIDVVSYPDIVWNKEAALSTYFTADHTYQNHYRVGGVKLTLDGSPQGKTAWLSKCYHVNPEGRSGCYTGYPIMPDDQAIAHVDTAFKHHWQILCHSNGDAAIDQYIKAVKHAEEFFGYNDHRTVMIHGQTLRKDQIPILVELSILPSLFPMHTFYWGDWHRESVLGEPRADYISPCRDVIDAGLTITSHHDAPVTFPNSMRVLDATVNRITRTGYVLGPDQRISVYEGLKSFTEWAAIQYFEEANKGTLEVGKLADFVILDKNPLKIDPIEIHNIQVLQSIKEGVTVFPRGN